jgi:hypothetical protein
MCKNVIGIALAVTIVGGFAIATGAAAGGSKPPSADANAPAMRTDGCPYYPSPVFCRAGSKAHTTSGT